MTEVLMFPGQGSQRAGMGSALFDRYRDLAEQASDILGWDVRRLCVENPDGLLDDTRYTQPAVFVVNALTYRAMREDRTQTEAWPDLALGHSLGEYNALEAAGVLSFPGGLRLVTARAQLTARVHGAMTVVMGLAERRVAEVLDASHLHGVDLANLNTPRQLVLAGPVDEIVRAEARLMAAGALDIRRLAVSGPFHSRYMRAVAGSWDEVLAAVAFRVPAFPVVANRTARPYGSGDYRRGLGEHLCRPVRWHESIRWIIDHHPDVRFREAGERGFLLRMLRQISPGHAPRPSVPAQRQPPAPAVPRSIPGSEHDRTQQTRTA